MALPKRQTSLLCVTVVAALIFIWQLIELFTHDIAAAPPEVPATTEVVTRAAAPVDLAPIPLTTTPEDRDFQQLLHRYELAKLQHRLAEEELAIAKAQQSIRELTQTDAVTQASDTPTNWHLKYLGNHQAHWSATLAHGDQLVNVFVGMKLNEHLVVMQINSQGVWLRSPHQLYQLTFSGLTTVATDAEPTVTTLSAASSAPPVVAPQPIEANTTQAIQPPVTSTPAAVTPATTRVPSFDETVLLAMPNHSYTLKLLTKTSESDLQNLMRKHHIKNRSFIYSHPCDTGRCFSLVYGDYLTPSAAQTAQASLPTALHDLTPEIVPVRTIQQTLIADGVPPSTADLMKIPSPHT